MEHKKRSLRLGGGRQKLHDTTATQKMRRHPHPYSKMLQIAVRSAQAFPETSWKAPARVAGHPERAVSVHTN